MSRALEDAFQDAPGSTISCCPLSEHPPETFASFWGRSVAASLLCGHAVGGLYCLEGSVAAGTNAGSHESIGAL